MLRKVFRLSAELWTVVFCEVLAFAVLLHWRSQWFLCAESLEGLTTDARLASK